MAHPTVLIVDEDWTSREILAAMTRFALPAETVEACPDGPSAMPHLAAGELKLVISAQCMPELADARAGTRPTRRGGPLPFMLMSSFDDNTWTQREAPLPNVLAFLQKPTSPREFMEMLRRVVPSTTPNTVPAR